MRYGLLAAAAVVVGTCAGEAEAARYYEFQIAGSAVVTPFLTSTSITQPESFTRASLFTATFDGTSQPFAVAGGIPETGAILLTDYGLLYTINSPGGTRFDFNFDLDSVATGEALRPLSVSGSYGYLNCSARYSSVCNYTGGTLLSVYARTSDIAPAYLGATESVQTFPLPETAAWAMMIVGFGVIGGALRRRRRVAVAFG